MFFLCGGTATFVDNPGRDLYIGVVWPYEKPIQPNHPASLAGSCLPV
jgi:hypothetical protein